ncbi:MAG: tyrosine protein phosphatase [Alphaproteobacteria bacterium]|nr:tyrosine protein phosphatase [Alphaproteobacteria bacterium]
MKSSLNHSKVTLLKPSIYLVSSSLPGTLYLMPKPSEEWLEEDIDHYRSVGVDVVVSLLEQDEASELGLENEDQVCQRLQIDFVQYSVRDRGLPEIEAFKHLSQRLASDLRQGRNVAVHCRAGIGRSGILVCCLLQHFGHSPEAAIEIASLARGVRVPDTDEQRKFIVNYEDQADC